MKKTLIVLLLSFSCFLHGQNKFKIEIIGQSNNICVRDSYSIYLDKAPFITTNLSAESSFLFSGGSNMNVDYILNSPIQFDALRKYSSGGGQQNPNCQNFSQAYASFNMGCETSNISFYAPNITFTKFNVFRIIPLAGLNSNLEFKTCENKLISFANNCNSFSYAIEYQIGSDPNWQAFAGGYSLKSSTISFNVSDFPGLVAGQILRLRVRYNNSVPFVYSDDSIILDVKGCTPKLNSQNNQVNNTCFGGAIGSIAFGFDRSLAPGETMKIFFTDPSGQSDNIDGITLFGQNNTYVFAGLLSGNYSNVYFQSTTSTGTLTPTSASNFTITSPPPIIFSTITTDVNCFGQSTGSITVNASGGINTPNNLRYSINNGTNWQTSNIFVGLAAGTYPVLVKEINGAVECIAPSGATTVNIIQPTAALSLVLNNFQDVYLANTTNQLQQGYINTTVSGGTTPYSYAWTIDGVPFTNTNTSNLEDLINLNNPSGLYNYVLTVTDAKGCTASVLQQIKSPEPIMATFVVEQIKCFGGKGKITATVSGGNAGPYTYSWTNTTSGATVVNTGNTSVISNLNSGIYTLTVTDFRAVSKTFSSQNINSEPSEIFVSGPITIQQKCANINGDNLIDISVFGGTESAAYDYRWYNINDLNVVLSNNQDLVNVPPGTYRVFVTDDNNCTNTKDFQIIAAIPIAITSTITNIINPGVNSGIININVSGGTGIYTFLWSNGVTTQNLNNLPAGNYSVVVKDSNNCSFTSPNYTITSPPPFVVSVSQTASIACIGQSTGGLTVNATGGTPAASPAAPYTYFWTHNGAATSSLSSLSAGIYTVQVRDANNILRSASFTITQPTSLAAVAVASPVTCNGLSNGTITISASGGTGTYVYKFSGDSNFSGSNIKTGLAAGTYSCEVKDSNGCSTVPSMINNIVIAQPALLTVGTPNITAVSMVGAADGAIQLTNVQGGTLASPAIYTYAWSGAPNTITNTTSNPTGLSAGTYTVTITGNLGCSISASYVVGTILPLTASVSQTAEIKCFGNTTGSLQVNAAGGKPNYTYLWSNGSTQQSISGLSAGFYSVTVKDSNIPISSVTTNFVVSQPINSLSASLIAKTDVLCFGNNTGSATVLGSGGTAPYTYSWTNILNVTIGSSSSTITNQPAGTYYCKVKDSNLCETIVTVVITQPSSSLLATLVSSTNVTINGQNTGSITVNATGGTSPYSFAWSNGVITTVPTINSLQAGTYSVTVTDSKGCIAILPATTITQPGILQGTISQSVPNSIRCFGDNTGSLTASVAGGIGSYVYTWRSNGIIIGSTNTINNLTAGTYQLTVSDNYTSIIRTFVLTQPTAVSASFTTTPVSCNGGSNGSITINGIGGTPPYSYTWSNGSTSQTQTGLTAGNYVVSIKDRFNCDSGLLFTTVQPSNGINLNAVVVNGVCNSTSSGSIKFSPTGGSGNFSISWNNQLYTGFIQNSLPPGIYTGAITDVSTGCVIPFSYTLIGGSPINVNLGNDILLCNGQTIEIDGTSVGSNLNYSWTSTNGFTSSNAKVNLNLAGTYTLNVTSSNGCVYTDSVVITTSQLSIESKYLLASQTFKDEEIILINVSDKTNTAYSWIFPVQAQIISQNQDAAVIKIQTAGVYDIGLRGTNQVGCVAYDFKKLVVDVNTNANAVDNNNVLIKKFQIYPNPIPTNSNLFNVEVELAHSLPLTISIFSISGSALINETTLPTSKNHIKQFDLLSLSTGYYYVVIKTPGSIQGKKIVKQ